MFITLKTLLHTLLLPPAGPLLLAALGAALLAGSARPAARRSGWALLLAAVGLYGRHRQGLAPYVPTPHALEDSTHALYELCGDLVRRALAALDLRRQTP
jgi:hypothetical protein